MSTDVTPDVTIDLSAYAADAILSLMGPRRINKSELARRLGVSDVWVGRRLNGQTPIDLRELPRIAVILGVGAMDLLPSKGDSASRGVTSMYLPGERVLTTIGTPDSRSTSSDVVQPRRTKRRKHPTVQKMHAPLTPLAK